MPIPDPQALILPILKALSPGGATLLSNVRRRKELTRLSWLGHKEVSVEAHWPQVHNRRKPEAMLG